MNFNVALILIISRMRSFCVDAAKSVAGIARIGLASVDAAVQTFISSSVVYHIQVLLFEKIHLGQGLNVSGQNN